MKILIIKLGALGDVINTLPLVSHLYEEFNAKITWIVEPLSLPLVKNHKDCKEAIVFHKKNWRSSFKEIKKTIKSERYDFVLDLQRILKSAYFTLNANGKRKVGFDRKRCKEMTWIFPFEKIFPKEHESHHMLDQYLEFSDYIGVGLPESPNWSIPVFDYKNEVKGKYVVLNTGATKPANKWFESSFAKLADHIKGKTDYKIVLTGGPEDMEFASRIVELAEQDPINLTGKTDIGQLTELLRGASYIVSCDTGPMHLGVALGKKVAGLFGPSNPVRTGPYYGKVITMDSDCKLCNKKECSSRECMNIDPEKVFKAVFLEPWSEMSVVYAS